MGFLDRLSQALTGLSAASAASEATRIRELLEEQNRLLSQPATPPQHIEQAARLTYSEKLEKSKQILDVVEKFDLTKNVGLTKLICPFSVAGVSQQDLLDYIEQAIHSSEWVYSDLSDRVRFLIYTVNKGVPAENIQRIFALMIFSRDAYNPDNGGDYATAWERLTSMKFPETDSSSSRIRYQFHLHGETIDEQVEGVIGLYIAHFFAPLHPLANIDSRHRLGLVRDRKPEVGTSSFFSAVKGDPTDKLLDFAIRCALDISFASILERLRQKQKPVKP